MICPNCKSNRLVLRAMAMVEFDPYPIPETEEIRISPLNARLVSGDFTPLLKPYMKCENCGSGAALPRVIGWYDSPGFVEMIGSYPEFIRMNQIPDVKDHYYPGSDPSEMMDKLSANSDFGAQITKSQREYKIPSEYPRKDKTVPWRVLMAHYKGFVIEILDFETGNLPCAFAVYRDDGEHAGLYGGRYKTAVRAKVAGMAAIDQIV